LEEVQVSINGIIGNWRPSTPHSDNPTYQDLGECAGSAVLAKKRVADKQIAAKALIGSIEDWVFGAATVELRGLPTRPDTPRLFAKK